MTYQHEMRHADAQQVLARYLEVKNFVSIFAPLRDDTFLTLGLQNASVRSGIRCAVPPSDNRSSSSTWLVQRTPQLIGHGGYDWHFLRGINVFGTRELVARHGTLWIDAVVVWPISDDGQVLDNPPVHIHHAFLGPYAFGFASTRHLPSFLHPLHLPHGDTPCDREAGGVDCYLFRFPYGHAIRVDQTLGLNFEGILNDVRPAGSPPLPFRLEMAVRYTTVPPLHEVGHKYVAPVSNFRPSLLEAVAAPRQTLAEIALPLSRGEAVLWGTWAADASGRLLNLWIHSHPMQGWEEMWLLDGSPLELGLEQGNMHLERCNSPFVPSAYGMTADDVRRRVLSTIEPSRLRCVWGAANVEAAADGTALTGRQARKRCFGEAARLVRGAPLTYIAFFSKARCLDCQLDAPGALGMQEVHLHMQGFVVRDEPLERRGKVYGGSFEYHYPDQFPGGPRLVCTALSVLTGTRVCAWELPFCGERANYPGLRETDTGHVELLQTARVLLMLVWRFPYWLELRQLASAGTPTATAVLLLAVTVLLGVAVTLLLIVRCCARSIGRRCCHREEIDCAYSPTATKP